MDYHKIQIVVNPQKAGGGDVVVNLPIVGAKPTDIYTLKGADGLGPVDLRIIKPDGVFQGTDPVDRQVVIRIGLTPNYADQLTPEKLRSTLHKMLNPTFGGVVLKLMKGLTVVAQTTGYASKFEVNPFSATPEVQVTFDCNGPYLEASTFITANKSAMQNLFTIENIGEVPVGFILLSTISAASDYWELTNDHGQWIRLSGFNFLVNDQLRIDTRDGLLDIKVTRAGVSIPLIGYMLDTSTWLKLESGDNVFQADSDEAVQSGSITYLPTYWGV